MAPGDLILTLIREYLSLQPLLPRLNRRHDMFISYVYMLLIVLLYTPTCVSGLLALERHAEHKMIAVCVFTVPLNAFMLQARI